MSSVFYEKRSEDVFVGEICPRPFPSHVHDVAEIVCITHGRVTMTIADKTFTLTPGDIAVAFPSVPHSYDAVSEDADGLALIFSPNTITEFTHNFRCMMLASPLLTAAQCDQEMPGIIATMQRLNLQKNKHLKLGYLHMFLSHLFANLRLQPLEKHMHTGLSSQVLHYISEHYTEPISLEIIARALGISRTHLSHFFSQQLKINFCQYINTLRIDYACYLLRDPAYTISQIVYLCGYGNPRTFHRAFMTHCKMTPKQYRSRFSAGDLPDEEDAADEAE